MIDKIKKWKVWSWIDGIRFKIVFIIILIIATTPVIVDLLNWNCPNWIIDFLLTIAAIILIIKSILYINKLIENIEKNDPTLTDVFFLIVFTIYMTLLLAYLSGTLLRNVSIFPKVGTQDGWLSLWGALGGGAMTILGVWYTIRKQNEVQEENNKLHEIERKEELAIQYKPYLDTIKVAKEIPFGSAYNSINFTVLSSFTYLSFSTVFKDPKCYLEFFNIGRGILCDLTFVSFEIINNDIFEHSYEYPKKYICSLAPGQKFYINFCIPSVLLLKQEKKEIHNDLITIKITLIATDEFNYNHFKIDIESVINLSMTLDTISYGKNNEITDRVVNYNYKIKSLKTSMITLPKN